MGSEMAGETEGGVCGTLDIFLRQNTGQHDAIPKVSIWVSRTPAEFTGSRIGHDKGLLEVAPDKSILVPYLNPHDMTFMGLRAREAVHAMITSHIPVVIFETGSGSTLDHILRNQDRVYHVTAWGLALAHEKDRTIIPKLMCNTTEVFAKDVIGRIIDYAAEKVRTGNADRTDEINLTKLREIKGQMDTPLHVFVDELRTKADYPLPIGHDTIFNTYRHFQELFLEREQQMEEKLNLKTVRIPVDNQISEYLAHILFRRDAEDERYLSRVCSYAMEKHRNEPHYLLGFPTGDKGFLFNERLKSAVSNRFAVLIQGPEELVELLGRH